jgi:hypothetical protein
MTPQKKHFLAKKVARIFLKKQDLLGLDGEKAP